MRSVMTALALCAILVLSAVPAAAQQASTARGAAFGGQLTGITEVGPTPEVSSDVPPGETDSDELLEVPADPALFSATLSVVSEAATTAAAEATLADVIAAQTAFDLPDAFNARGFAVTEDLSALEDTLTADVLEAEALATCDGTTPVFTTGSRIENLGLSGQDIDLIDQVIGPDGLQLVTNEPNDVVLDDDTLGLQIVAWDTNWDGTSGTTDGSDTVFVNALRVTVTEDGVLGELLGGAQELLVSHAEASVNCAADIGAPGDNPLDGVRKDASTAVVSPGETFTYTITIPNGDATCTLENVRVEDRITGPAGSEVVTTNPTADSVEGLTVIWNDVGPITPGAQVVLTIDVRVADNAPDGALFREDLNVTADCDGAPVSVDVPFDGPSVEAPVPPGATTPAPATLPQTGGGLGVGLLLLTAGAAGLVLRGRSELG